jgi:hypothetical protein
VGGHDERRVRGERGREAARDEEVRVDDVGAEPTSGAPRTADELHVAALAPGAPVEDGALELVAALGERPFHLRHERPEIGVVRAGIHLRDEQDAHGARSLTVSSHLVTYAREVAR